MTPKYNVIIKRSASHWNAYKPMKSNFNTKMMHPVKKTDNGFEMVQNYHIFTKHIVIENPDIKNDQGKVIVLVNL
jgi:hypothetical protein